MGKDFSTAAGSQWYLSAWYQQSFLSSCFSDGGDEWLDLQHYRYKNHWCESMTFIHNGSNPRSGKIHLILRVSQSCRVSCHIERMKAWAAWLLHASIMSMNNLYSTMGSGARLSFDTYLYPPVPPVQGLYHLPGNVMFVFIPLIFSSLFLDWIIE